MIVDMESDGEDGGLCDVRLAENVCRSTQEVFPEWSEHVMTVAGLGNLSSADKATAFVHQCALVAGNSPAEILEYTGEHFSFTADEGVEDAVVDSPVSVIADYCIENNMPAPPEFSADKVAEHLANPETQHKAFLFPKAVRVKGTRHGTHRIAGNLTLWLFHGVHRLAQFDGGDSLTGAPAPISDSVKVGLKSAARLLALRTMRDRLLATAWKNVPAERLPQPKPGSNAYSKLRWPVRTLTEWRWGDIVMVIVPLLRLRGVIEDYWLTSDLSDLLYAEDGVERATASEQGGNAKAIIQLATDVEPPPYPALGIWYP